MQARPLVLTRMGTQDQFNAGVLALLQACAHGVLTTRAHSWSVSKSPAAAADQLTNGPLIQTHSAAVKCATCRIFPHALPHLTCHRTIAADVRCLHGSTSPYAKVRKVGGVMRGVLYTSVAGTVMHATRRTNRTLHSSRWQSGTGNRGRLARTTSRG
jgi:hypothetical protein